MCLVSIRNCRLISSCCVCQCKKLPSNCENGDGYVTEEDETLDCDQQRKMSKKVRSNSPATLLWLGN